MLPTYEPAEKLCRIGLEALGPPDQFDEIVCANDSVYGPLFALDPAFADALVADADLWGMCLSEHFARVEFRIAGLYDAGAAGAVTWRELLPHLSLWQPARSRRHFRKARRMPHNPSELVWRLGSREGSCHSDGPGASAGLARSGGRFRIILGPSRHNTP